MDKYFDRFLGLVEEAEAELPEAGYFQLLDDINRVSGDKVFDGRTRAMRRMEAEMDRLEEERVALCGA